MATAAALPGSQAVSFTAQLGEAVKTVATVGQAQDAATAAIQAIAQNRDRLISLLNLGARDEANSLLDQAQTYLVQRVQIPLDGQPRDQALDDMTAQRVRTGVTQVGNALDQIALLDDGDQLYALLSDLVGGIVSTFSAAGTTVVHAAGTAIAIVPWYVWAIVAVVGAVAVYAMVKT